MQYTKLCLCKGRDDAKDLEGVLSVLDRRLDDGGNRGVVLRSLIGAESPADLQFGLGRPQCLLGVVVGGRDGRIDEEGKYIVPMLGDAFFKFVKFGLLAVFPGAERRSFEQLVQSFLHVFPDRLPDVTFVAAVDGLPDQVEHVQAPWVILKGLHGVGEVAQQVGEAYLVVVHSHVRHEVGRKPVGDPYHIALFLRGEVLVDDIVASAAVKRQEGGHGILENPEPVVFPFHVDPGLVRPGDLSPGDFPAYHLIGRGGELAHGVEHVGHGSFADVKSEDGFEQVGEPLEGDILISAQVGCHGHDVGAERHGGVHLLGELSLAAMPAGALHLHRHMVDDRGRDRKRYVHHLACGAHAGGVHLQGLPALRALTGGIPPLGRGHIAGLEQGAPPVPFLSARHPVGRLALGLCVADAHRVFRWRDAAVHAALLDGLPATLEFGDAGCQIGNTGLFHFHLALMHRKDKTHPGKFPVLLLNGFGQGPVGVCLDQQSLRQFRGVKLVTEAEFPKYLLATPGEVHPVRLEDLPESCVKVLFHTCAKIGKIIDKGKFNDLMSNELEDIPRHSDGTGAFPPGGLSGKILIAENRLQIACNRLISSIFNTDMAA